MVTLAGSADIVELRVDDHGPDIEPSQIEHVFDRFWRADAARTRRTGGSGLGLAITKYIVEAHHGTIAVTNQPGGGVAFTITLPAMPPSSDRAERTAVHSEAPRLAATLPKEIADE